MSVTSRSLVDVLNESFQKYFIVLQLGIVRILWRNLPLQEYSIHILIGVFMWVFVNVRLRSCS